MSTARPPAPPRRPRRRVALVFLAAGALVAAGVGGYLILRQRPPAVPEVALDSGDPEVAATVRAAQEEVRRQPRSADAWGRLGMVLVVHDFRPEGLACLAEAERLAPAEPRWPYFQGLMLLQGDPDAAIPKLERAAEHCGDSAAPRLRLAEVLLTQGRIDEAESHLLRLKQAEPGNPRAALGLARVARARGAAHEALTRLDRCRASPFTRKAAQSLRAELLRQLGDAAAERERGQGAALPNDQDWPDPYAEELARVHVGLQGRLARADRLMARGQRGEAVGVLYETTRIYPDAERPWVGLGRCLLDHNAYPAAERALREALRCREGSVDAHFYLGVILQRQGRPAEAAPHFRRALALKPDHALAHYNLGHCLLRQDDPAGARAEFAAAVTCRPHFPDGHVSLGELLLRSGDRAAAVPHLLLAVEQSPGNPLPRKLLHQALADALSHFFP